MLSHTEHRCQDRRLQNCFFTIGLHLMLSSSIDAVFCLNSQVIHHLIPSMQTCFLQFIETIDLFTDDLIPFVCQRESCPNAGNAEATKVCYDHNISITYAPDTPPPLYLCIECANEIHRENPNQTFGDILHPMAQVSMICENKVCIFDSSFEK